MKHFCKVSIILSLFASPLLGTDTGTEETNNIQPGTGTESDSYNKRIVDKPEFISYRTGRIERIWIWALAPGQSTPRGSALISFHNMTPTHFGYSRVITDAVELTQFQRKFSHMLRGIQRSDCPATARPIHTTASQADRKKWFSKVGMMVHVCNSGSWGLRQENCHKSEASLG